MPSPITLIDLPDGNALRSRVAALKTRVEVETAIAPAREGLLLLLSTLNDLWNHHVAPISSLPETLLSQILIEAVGDESIGRSTEKGWEQRVGLSSVCKSWRIVTLGCPAFWAGLRLRPGCKDLPKMLPRWQKYPRSVDVDFKFSNTIWAPFPELLNDGDQLADLKITSLEVRWFAEAWETWPKEWNPQVRSLDMRSLDLTAYAYIPSHFVRSVITPALRHLVLHSFEVEWETLNPLLTLGDDDRTFANLTALTLSELSPPPPETLLNHILSSAQHLQSLTIKDSFPNEFKPAFRWNSPSLIDLCLIDFFDHVGKTFLWITSNSMSTHPDLRIKLTASDDDSSLEETAPSNDLAPMAQLVTDMVDRFAAIISKPAVFKGGRRLFVSESISRFSIRVLDPEVEDLGLAPMSLDINYFHPEVDHIWFSAFARICVPHAENVWLNIRTDADRSLEVWRHFLEKHSKIEALSLSVPPGYQRPQLIEVIRLLSFPPEPPESACTETSVGSILLPELRTLSLVELPAKSFVNELESMLFARWQAGYPVALVRNIPSRRKLRERHMLLLQRRVPRIVTQFVQRRSDPDYSSSEVDDGDDDDESELEAE